MEKKDNRSPSESNRLWDQKHLHPALSDFRDASRKAFVSYTAEYGIAVFPQTHSEKSKSFDHLILFRTGLAWFGATDSSGLPLGAPEDYPRIKNDPSQLKEFMGQALDKGRHHIYGGRFETDYETSGADYIKWLYQNSSSAEFRTNAETGLIELLREELEQGFASYDYDAGRKKAEDDFEGRYGDDMDKFGAIFFRQPIARAAQATYHLTLGLEYASSPEDRAFKEYFESEIAKVLKPITLDEYMDMYVGESRDRKVKRVWIERFNEGTDFMTIHFSDAPDEFKERLKEFYLNKKAEFNAVSEFTPQFNRLVGLLDIVSELGDPGNGFSDAYLILFQKARENFQADAPTLQYDLSSPDINHMILLSLVKLQPKEGMGDFWLDKIQSDINPKRVETSVHGLLSLFDSKVERRSKIPSILQAISQRGYDMDEGTQYLVGGFIFDANYLDRLLGKLVKLSYDRSPFFHLDKPDAALNILKNKSVGNGIIGFEMSRYTPNGVEDKSAFYSIEDDLVTGDSELDSSIRAYLEKGYPISDEVSVTSIEGRSKGDYYEGIVGLNNSYFPFKHFPEKGEVLLAAPIDIKITIGQRYDDWERRRIGLDNLPPHAAYMDIDMAGQAVNELAAANTNLINPIGSLVDKVSYDLAPNLSTVIKSRLINNRDKLID